VLKDFASAAFLGRTPVPPPLAGHSPEATKLLFSHIFLRSRTFGTFRALLLLK
jgi:hypothetical protein